MNVVTEMIKSSLKSSLTRFPAISEILHERDRFRHERDQARRERDELLRQPRPWVPIGEYYSPIPSSADVAEFNWDKVEKWRGPIPGVELNDGPQRQLARDLGPLLESHQLSREKRPGVRFCLENDMYTGGDALTLQAVLRHLKPRKIFEVGSGHSSALMMDVNQRLLETPAEITFIEPYPSRLFSIMEPGDRDRYSVVQKRIQDVELSFFSALDAGDVLFIDSTHVSKFNSDVNYELFEILPSLKPGVFVHIHDVEYPFEYRRSWVKEGRSWNEAYLLRAFLQYNSAFEVFFFNTYLAKVYPDLFRDHPMMFDGCNSIWLRKR